MKKIEALINPFELEAVKQGLVSIGITRLTAIEAKTPCQDGNRAFVFRGTEFREDFTPMTKIEIVVTDEMVEPAAGVILEAARTAKGAEAEIYVSTVEQPFRARDGRRTEQALHA